MSAVNIAKAAHYLNLPLTERKAFSLADIKTQYFNRAANREQMLNLFLAAAAAVNFQLDPDLKENRAAIQQILNYGRMAA